MKLRTEQAITVASAVGIVCLFVTVVHLPQSRELKELKVQIHAEQEKLAQAKQESSGLMGLNKRVQSLRTVVGDFNKRLPDRSELGVFLEQIVAKLKSANLVSQEIRPQSPSSTERYSELPVAMNFRGSFQNICAFLLSIEQITHLTQVETLQLESRNIDGPTIDARMVLKVYCSRS